MRWRIILLLLLLQGSDAAGNLLFSHYCQEGGLPEYLQYHLPEYLHTLYENILYKDIVARYKLSSERVIKQLAHYLASHVAKDISYNKLAHMLASSASTISDYSQYFETCYLFFSINRFSASLRKQQGYHKKNYCIDTALAQTIGFRLSGDDGRMLENIVYLELKRRYQEVYFHREKHECDFVLKENHQIVKAIQVALHLDDLDTKKREIAGVREAMEYYGLQEGWILTEDDTEELAFSVDDKQCVIHVQPVWRWLILF